MYLSYTSDDIKLPTCRVAPGEALLVKWYNVPMVRVYSGFDSPARHKRVTLSKRERQDAITPTVTFILTGYLRKSCSKDVPRRAFFV